MKVLGMRDQRQEREQRKRVHPPQHVGRRSKFPAPTTLACR